MLLAEIANSTLLSSRCHLFQHSPSSEAFLEVGRIVSIFRGTNTEDRDGPPYQKTVATVAALLNPISGQALTTAIEYIYLLSHIAKTDIVGVNGFVLFDCIFRSL